MSAFLSEFCTQTMYLSSKSAKTTKAKSATATPMTVRVVISAVMIVVTAVVFGFVSVAVVGLLTHLVFNLHRNSYCVIFSASPLRFLFDITYVYVGLLSCSNLKKDKKKFQSPWMSRYLGS